jgi:hypothetical protein
MKPWSKLAAVLACALALACAPEAPKPSEAPAPEITRINGADLVLQAPEAGARLASPFQVTGTAPGTWYFEAVFHAELVTADGVVLDEAPAQAQGDWMTVEQVPFAAEFAFDVAADTPATIVLREDMQEEGPSREVRIPVVLAPSP